MEGIERHRRRLLPFPSVFLVACGVPRRPTCTLCVVAWILLLSSFPCSDGLVFRVAHESAKQWWYGLTRVPLPFRTSCVVWQRLDKLVQMCGSVDGVYLALIGDGAMGPVLSERHGCWSNSGKRRTKVQGTYLPHVSLRARLGY